MSCLQIGALFFAVVVLGCAPQSSRSRTAPLDDAQEELLQSKSFCVRQVWRRKFDGELRTALTPNGETLCVSSHGNIEFVATDTGETRFVADVSATSLLVSPDSRVLWCQEHRDGTLVAVSLATGNVIGTRVIPADAAGVSLSGVGDGGALYVRAEDGQIGKLTADDTPVKWVFDWRDHKSRIKPSASYPRVMIDSIQGNCLFGRVGDIAVAIDIPSGRLLRTIERVSEFWFQVDTQNRRILYSRAHPSEPLTRSETVAFDLQTRNVSSVCTWPLRPGIEQWVYDPNGSVAAGLLFTARGFPTGLIVARIQPFTVSEVLTCHRYPVDDLLIAQSGMQWAMRDSSGIISFWKWPE